VEVNIGDVVCFGKEHPCGGERWLVVRIGVDIGIKCEKCGRRVMMERPEFENRVKEVVSRGSIDSK
jgi:hypothetical protein